MPPAATGSAAPAVRRVVPRWAGSTRYALRATVSHMGRSAHSGHYVCHARRAHGAAATAGAATATAAAAGDGGVEWLLFNDALVAACPAVPLEHAYVYVYERVDD